MSSPERLSVADRVTVTAPAYQPLASGAGTLEVVTGGVRSIFTEAVPVPVFPALSDTDADAESAGPSPVIVLSAGQEPATPDSGSAQVQWMVTSV